MLDMIGPDVEAPSPPIAPEPGEGCDYSMRCVIGNVAIGLCICIVIGGLSALAYYST